MDIIETIAPNFLQSYLSENSKYKNIIPIDFKTLFYFSSNSLQFTLNFLFDVLYHNISG